MSTMSDRPVLVIERLTVRADRVVCDVALAPGAPRRSTPALAARLRENFPHLPSHACVNDEGGTFAAVMDHTSLPHVLEHLVIDLQTRDASSDGDTVFVGTTEWTDARSGHARIEVSFTDDMVALRCFRDATDFLNRAVVT